MTGKLLTCSLRARHIFCLDSWKNNCRIWNLGALFPEIKCRAATKSMAEIGSEIASCECLSQCKKDPSASNGSNGLLPRQRSNVYGWPNANEKSILESISYFHFHFENSFFGCCHCRSVLLQSKFCRQQQFPDTQLLDSTGLTAILSIYLWAGQLVLHLHCTVQESI